MEFITQEITGNKEVKVEKQDSGDLKIFTIRAPKEVMGLLIGREGRTVRAIRTLARARAIVDKESVAVRLEEV